MVIRFFLFALALSFPSCASMEAAKADDEFSNSERVVTKRTQLSCRKKFRGRLKENQEIYVYRVSDGDTFWGCVLPQGEYRIKMRVLGIDCPENSWNPKCERDGRMGRLGCREQIPLGRLAKAKAIGLVLNKTVRLESKYGNGRFIRDSYKRVLPYVRLPDDTDFGLEMIKGGFCEDFGWKFEHPRSNQYRKAQEEVSMD